MDARWLCHETCGAPKTGGVIFIFPSFSSVLNFEKEYFCFLVWDSRDGVLPKR